MANLFETLQKQADEENYKNKLNYCLMIAISYLMKRKIKKIILEVIFNIKIFLEFCSMKMPTTTILENLQGD